MFDIVNNTSICELFGAIDNVEKSVEENDLIVNKIKDNFSAICRTYFYQRKARKKKEDLIKKYMSHLKGLFVLIEKQMLMLEELLNYDEYFDCCDELAKLQKELIEYNTKECCVQVAEMAEILSKDEFDIYKKIYMYDIINSYQNAFSRADWIIADRLENKIKESITTRNWKSYFYLFINIEKQHDFLKDFKESYIANKSEADNSIVKLKNLYVDDFQGQISKAVFCRRTRLKLTQAQLSEKSGIDRTMIVKIEKNRQPTTLETAIKLLSTLGMGMVICPLEE